MSTQFSSYKRVLTQACNKVEAVVARAQKDYFDATGTEDDRNSREEKKIYSELQELLGAIETGTTKVEELWQKYESAFNDRTDGPSNSEQEDFEQYSKRAEATLSSAYDLTMAIQGRLRTFTSPKGNREVPHTSASDSAQQDFQFQTRKVDLPTVPIPSFSGNVWDWDNFWTLFSTNVHSQPLPPIYKFNYLLDALKGEARDAVRKFQITEDNYQKAIDFLHTKYGNKEELVHRLIARMETATLRSPSVRDQRVLLEQLQAIMSQLRDKGENVDSQWLVKQVLSKFPERLQRKALKKKRSMEGPFLMENLLDSLDQFIADEEMIALFTSSNTVAQQQQPQKAKPQKEQTSRGSLSCMYCGEDHKASACTRYCTPQERANYLREHKLCFICASAQHATSDCRKRPCFACQGKHHTSCCFKAMTTPKTSTPRQGKSTAPTKPNEKVKFAKKASPMSASTHQLSNQDQDHFTARIEQQEDPVAQLHSSEGIPITRETYLPIGELTILNPSSRELRKVPALLDSGAECSVIDHKLAEELRLPTLGTTTLRVRTFGSDRVQECVSRKVPLEMWDNKGKLWSLELLTHRWFSGRMLACHAGGPGSIPGILSDSEIALNWIRTTQRPDAGPFVRNRIFEIRSIVRSLEESGYAVQFGHISSHENPADCATRGLDKWQLADHLWWTGPKFLSQPTEVWDSAYTPITLLNDDSGASRPEEGENNVAEGPQNTRVFAQSQTAYTDIFHEIRGSDFRKIQRVVAFVLRFIKLLVARVNERQTVPIRLSQLLDELAPVDTPIPSGKEVRAACKALVKQHQLSWITPSIRKSFRHLQPYVDEQGILRCRGRLGRSDLDEQAKFPMLVLQKTWLSRLIIMDGHRELHTSISHTMCRVRERYWIPKLRAEVTSIIRHCTECQKMNNLPYKYPDQGHLPARRVTRSRPYEHIGLDYFGPLSVKGEGGPEKCYGCIITCLVTKLIHLELVSDVSTIAFLHMLRRFFARRGIPKSITSDNAPTFALGDIILSEWLERAKDDPTIAKEISSRQIQWTYNTPYAPWQGGVYERLIRSVKLAMNKSLGKITPSREELGTLIVEIESMLNTRPLLYAESEEGSERVLRPIDFLQNELEVLPPMQVGDDHVEDHDYLSPAERLASQTKSQVVQAIDSSCRITEQFWQQWQSQYLTSLREKHQKEVGHRRGSRIAPKVGQVVLICDALQARYMWKMGRIDELVSNKEGVVREASVMLPSRRKIRRPVNLLVPLELDDTGTDVDTESTSQQHPESSPAVVEGEVDESQPVDTESSRYDFRPSRRVDYRKLARSHVLPLVTVTWVSVERTDDPMEQIPALVSHDEQDPGDLNLRSVEGSESDFAEAEDVVRDEQQEDIENGGPGPEVRVQQDDVEETDPGPEVRVQQVNVEEADLGPEVRVGQGNGQIDEQEAELIERIQAVEFRIQRLRMQFSGFSFRKSEWRSPGMPPDLVCAFYGEVGMHYSESCPRITDGDERDDIIRQNGASFQCMDFCPGGQRCKYAHRRCFYCEKLEGTEFQDLIPRDEGHHSALCNVPHKKGRARSMIQELEDESRWLAGQLQVVREQRNQDGGPQHRGPE